MRESHRPWRTLLLAAMAMAVIVAFVPGAFAADPPVKVTFTPGGDAVPGGTATLKATVVINNGSTLTGMKWTQLSGAHATLANTTTDTVTATLPAVGAFKAHLIEVLEEPPVTADQLPAHVPFPAEYEGGLQNRFTVVAVPPRPLEEAGDVLLDLEVTTTSGTYHNSGSILVAVPWSTSTGNRNVAIGLPVIVHGKNQASYAWTMTPAANSTATLKDATTQNPEFLPDVPGKYVLTVTDLATNKPVSLTVFAGTWRGMITGQDADGHPVADTACTGCHVKNTPHFDLFTPWAKSGHAEIFTQNVDTPAGHYAESCLSCHTVGFDKGVQNKGIDEMSDWAAFRQTDLLTHGAAGNWTKILQQFPNTAKMANIQCENCHGPQDSLAHGSKDGSRQTLSSDLCGSCHGEPSRHGRYQQWQLSGHANYVLAVEEGTDPSCGKCHSGQGFIQWQDNGFSTANLTVDWTVDSVHPQTCATCHEPHNVGTLSSGPTTDATVRVAGTTPKLDAGFTATGVGSAALCMTCHNGRRGLKDDQHFNTSDLSRAPHVGPQADVVMGQNLFFVKVGTRGNHSNVTDSCVTCHMESSGSPAPLSNPPGTGGTNHTFFASKTICSKCHSTLTADSVQGPVSMKMATLKASIETALKNVMQSQIRLGNTIDIGGLKTIKSAADIAKVEFVESHGRQAAAVTLADNSKLADTALNAIKVVRPAGSPVEILAVADPNVAKAGWNYMMVNSDKSMGVHNPLFVNSALDVAVFAVNDANTAMTNPPAGMGGAAALGGGLGNGAGAVSCTTPYVYWAELVGHLAGNAGSQWRSDIVARNLGSTTANLKFVLHQAQGNVTSTGTVSGGAQKAFEDIVAAMGATDKGALEVCSDQPLLVVGRTFNQADTGTFGQNIDGHVADQGLMTGQTVSLLGLRQKTGAFRTNLSVTNAGASEAQVSITLFDAAGTALKTYTLTVPAGQVVQDTDAFANRAGAPDVGWGFATVTVMKGTNVRTSAALVDMKTNDPTTIMPKM